jgi:hypothetical protein
MTFRNRLKILLCFFMCLFIHSDISEFMNSTMFGGSVPINEKV